MKTWRSEIKFIDENMPNKGIMFVCPPDIDGKDEALTNLSILLNRYAGVASGTITDPEGNKHCYTSRGEYLFTVPKNIFEKKEDDSSDQS